MFNGPYELHWNCTKCGWIQKHWTDPGNGGLCPNCGNTGNTKFLIKVIKARLEYNPIWWNPLTWFSKKWVEL